MASFLVSPAVPLGLIVFFNFGTGQGGFGTKGLGLGGLDNIIFFLRYNCNKFDDFTGGILLMWNTSVSDHCCHHCDGVVYKADVVMDTIHHEDECQTVETSVCRILPGL